MIAASAIDTMDHWPAAVSATTATSEGQHDKMPNEMGWLVERIGTDHRHHLSNESIRATPV